MAPASPAPMPTSSPARGPDLARLRIDRGPSAPPMRRRSGLLLILFLALAGFVGWAYASGRLDLSRGEPPVEVATATVTANGRNAVPVGRVTGNGYVIARRRAALSTVLSGRLVEVNVEEGGTVTAGDVVARIQHDDYDAAVVAAKQDVLVARGRRTELEGSHAAAVLDLERLRDDRKVLADLVTQAEAESKRTAADVERNRELAERRVIDSARWDALVAASNAAAAGLAAARGKVTANRSSETAWAGEIARRAAAVATADAEIVRAEEAERQAAILVEKTFVRAPFDGLVVHKDAEVGEVVSATGAGGNSRGSVATIVDPKTLEVQVELSETRLGTIAQGDAASITLEADPDRSYRGSVRQVWPTADRNKATVEMRVEFVERPPIVKPEMGARVVFLGKDDARPATADGGSGPAAMPPRVPKAALATRAGRTVAFVVAGGRVRQVDVSTGAESSGQVDVTAGLSGSESVVLDPPAGLADGDAVTVRERR